MKRQARSLHLNFRKTANKENGASQCQGVTSTRKTTHRSPGLGGVLVLYQARSNLSELARGELICKAEMASTVNIKRKSPKVEGAEKFS